MGRRTLERCGRASRRNAHQETLRPLHELAGAPIQVTDGKRRGVSEQAINIASLGAGVSYANLAIGLPLLALAYGETAFIAGSLIAFDTIAIAIGAFLALVLRRPESGVAHGLCLIAAGEAVLIIPASTTSMAVGAVLHGVGNGLFWVGVQAALGRRAGRRGSERAFVLQYSMYICGSVAGGVLTGIGIAALSAVGTARTTSISLTFLFGIAAALIALLPVISWLKGVSGVNAKRPRPTLLGGLAFQTPDLFLVGAMGMVISLFPVVLTDIFELPPLAVGVSVAAIAVAKIAGSFAAGRLAPRVGAGRTVGSMLAASACCSALLIAAHRPVLYIALTVASTFFGIGAWPIIVDGALARIQPNERPRVTIAWNVREYTAIALTTVAGGYLLDVTSSPTVLLAFATALLAVASLCALTVLRVPSIAPPEQPERHTRVGLT